MKIPKPFTFNLTPHLNGGESLLFTFQYVNGIPIEELTLSSYSSSSTICTSGVLNSENLFRLAKELQKYELEQLSLDTSASQ